MNIIVKSPKFGDRVAIVDDAESDLIKPYNWVLDVRKNGRMYARASIKVAVNNFKYIYLHRIVMGFPKGMIVDHIDQNGLNNSRSNLRLTPIIGGNNSCNSKIPTNNSSGFKGVHYYKAYGRYSVHLVSKGKRIFGGYFNDPILAAKRYNELAIENYGEFACLNKIPNE